MSVFGIYKRVTSIRFDRYVTDGEYITLYTTRFQGWKSTQSIGKICFPKRFVSHIESSKHLSYGGCFLILLSCILLVAGIVDDVQAMYYSALTALISSIWYVVYNYISAALIIHTEPLGDFTSGICMEDNDDIFEWYMGKKRQSR